MDESRSTDTGFGDGTRGLDTADLNQRQQNWYDRWRDRTHRWVSRKTNSALANVILIVPDLFVMIVGLLGDKRVDINMKIRLALLLAYVISPIDLLPEAALGAAGLADDATMMVALLYAMATVFGMDPQVLRDHWRGQGDVIEVLTAAYQTLDNMLGGILPGDGTKEAERDDDTPQSPSDAPAAPPRPREV